jgi:hypothetical protein
MNILTLKIRLVNTPLYRRAEVLDCINMIMLSQVVEIVFSIYDAEQFSMGFKDKPRPGGPSGPLSRKKIKTGDVLVVGVTDSSKVTWNTEVTVEDIRPYKYRAKDYSPLCIEVRYPDPMFEDDPRQNDARYLMSHWDEYMADNNMPKDTDDFTEELQEYWRQLYPSDGRPLKENPHGAKIIPLKILYD